MFILFPSILAPIIYMYINCIIIFSNIQIYTTGTCKSLRPLWLIFGYFALASCPELFIVINLSILVSKTEPLLTDDANRYFIDIILFDQNCTYKNIQYSSSPSANKRVVTSLEWTIQQYFTISEHLKSDLIGAEVFSGSSLFIRGILQYHVPARSIIVCLYINLKIIKQ